MTFFESGESCRLLYCYLSRIRYCWHSNMQKSRYYTHTHTMFYQLVLCNTTNHHFPSKIFLNSKHSKREAQGNFTPDEEIKRNHANVNSLVKGRALQRYCSLFKLKLCFRPVWPFLGNSLYNFLFYRNKSNLSVLGYAEVEQTKLLTWKGQKWKSLNQCY